MAITLGAITFCMVLAILQPTLVDNSLGGQSDENVDGSNAAFSIYSVADCQQRTFIPTRGGTFHSCPAIVTSSAAITNLDGFPACVRMYGDSNDSHPTTYDFVLRPNSNGYINVVYDFGIYELPTSKYFADLMEASDVHRLGSDGKIAGYSCLQTKPV